MLHDEMIVLHTYHLVRTRIYTSSGLILFETFIEPLSKAAEKSPVSPSRHTLNLVPRTDIDELSQSFHVRDFTCPARRAAACPESL